MNRIGTYNGINCFVCSDTEYKNELKNGNDNGKCIYIIEGTMVKRNRIIGHYDGSTVRDVYDGVPYVVERKPAPQRPLDTESAKSAEVEEVVKEIRFSDYSKVVAELDGC